MAKRNQEPVDDGSNSSVGYPEHEEIPVEVEVPAEQPAPEPAPAEPAPLEQAVVTAKKFMAMTGAKHVDMAGFISWAGRKGHTLMTVPDWKALYSEFQNTPV